MKLYQQPPATVVIPDKLRLQKAASVILVLFIFVTGSINLQSQNGLSVEFYDGTNFERLVSTGTMSEINMHWHRTPPVSGIDPEACSIRWTGRLKAPKTGVYEFSARVDDGIRVWLGDQLLMDNWHLNDLGLYTVKAEMNAGQFYDLKVEYFNALIEGEIRLMWELPKEEESWYKRLFSERKPEIIQAQHFYLHMEESETKIVELVADLSDAPPSKSVGRKPNKKVIKKKKEPSPAPVVIEENKNVKAEDKLPTPPKLRLEEMTPDIIKIYTPENVQFDQAQVEILPSSFGDLDILAEFLSKNSFLHVRIEGHTDVAGDSDKNMKLSERRAFAVARYLVKNGVKPQSIEALGLGGTQPLIRSAIKVYHPENRRVSFVISIPK